MDPEEPEMVHSGCMADRGADSGADWGFGGSSDGGAKPEREATHAAWGPNASWRAPLRPKLASMTAAAHPATTRAYSMAEAPSSGRLR